MTTVDAPDFPRRSSLPRATPALGRDAVEHWVVPLDAAPEVARAAGRTLSRDERERAERFRFEIDRRRYTIAHAALRAVLAAYAGTRPRELRFATVGRGKPVLAWPASDLHFSLAHAADVAVLAVARGASLGVDIERLRPFAERDLVAQRMFSAAECGALQDLSPDARDRGFFLRWTRKEACVKAIGAGLCERRAGAAVTAGWSLHRFVPAAGYVGATVVCAPSSQALGWTLDAAALGGLADLASA